ncbi:alpha-L-rhamnosidase-related protein [Nocardia panacis]|nr:alpha-L-rhamnosidase [Nocardia panacis]
MWTGQWIWSEETALGGPTAAQPYGSLHPDRLDRRVLFRRGFELARPPERASMRITADSRYRLYVNGIEIGAGPVRHGPRQLSFDVHEIDGALRVGTNVVAVLARFYGHPVPWWEPSPPSLTLGGGSLVAEVRLDDRVIGTDDTWRCVRAQAWQPGRPAGMLLSQLPETFDARLLDPQWATVEFDDSGWSFARVLAEHSVVGPQGSTRPPTEPWGVLTPRAIPELTGETHEAAVVDQRPAAAFDRGTTSESEHRIAAVSDPRNAPESGRRIAAAPDRRTMPDLDPHIAAVSGRHTAAASDRRTAPASDRHTAPASDRHTAPASDRHTAPEDIDPRAVLTAALGGNSGARTLLIADFAMIVSGRLDLRFDAPGGSTIDGALVEVPTVAALDSAPVFRYVTRGWADTYRSDDSVGGRYLVLAFDPGVHPVTLRLREHLRPRTPVAPFVCSDARLDNIYRVGLRTVDLTAHDAYIDCPTREQRAWTGDGVVHQSVDLIANRDWRLARWNPVLAAQPRVDGLLPMVVAGDFATTQVPTIPDWSLHWIRSVHNLFRYTGDKELVGSLLPTVEGVLRFFEPYCGPDDLIAEVPGWVLIDWSPVQVRGASAALNALVARALRDFADMARWLGDSGRVRWAVGLHARLRRGFEAFWDPARGAYRDNIVAGRLGTGVSEHVAAAAVCADLVPARRKPLVLRLLLDRPAMFTASPLADHGGDAVGPSEGQPVSARAEPDWDTEHLVVGAQPFFRYVVHDALAMLGAADRIAELCLDWNSLLADAPTALRECWEGGSYCHGWSATPTRDLIRYTLGITPAEPGYAVVRIAPRPGILTAASGAAPTPHGDVTVAIDGDHVSIDSPVPVELVDRAGVIVGHPAGRIRVAF